VGLEEGPLAPTEITFSLEYESESEINTTSSLLPRYISSLSIPLPSSSSPIDSLSSYHTMSQQQE